ncbi:hypothetical protein Tco_1139900, partial [Tanacetum coccineum]
HPANVQSFPDPIMFLTSLKASWEHSPKHLAIFVGGKAFWNFMFAEDDEEMTFLPYEPSPGFGYGSPYASIKNEPPLLEAELLDSVNSDQLVENTADSRGSPVHEKMPITGSHSLAERMKNRRCRTKGYVKPPVKRKLVHAGSSSRSTRQESSPSPMEAKAESSAYLTISDDDEELQTTIDCHLMVFNVTLTAWRGHLDNQSKVELLDLYDRCYARQAVVDNAIKSLLDEVNEHKSSMDRLLLESQKWAGYQENLATLKSKVAALEAEKGKLEAAEAMLHEEIEAFKCDREEVVSKVVPYFAMELVHSDEMAMLIGRLVKGYRPTYKKEHTKASNYIVAATDPFLSEVVADPSASVEALLSKKPKSLCRLTLTKTNAPAPSTPS